MENQIPNLQTTMERIKQPKVQPHMTLQSLSKHIKQENEERTNNQESKKHWRSTYTQWFASRLWPHIQIVVKKHRSLRIALHYLCTFHRK